jgi:UDP-N-acetylmuramate--alanine ligase
MPTNVLIPFLPPHVHMLGIGGAGVSGAARILAARGHVVTGHDRAESELLRALDGLVAVSIGASKAEDLPGGAGLVVRSAAVPLDDPQVRRAFERGITVIKYSQLLARLAPASTGLAVAGTHGKTTTSWMLWHALRGLAEAGFGRGARAFPGALVGGLNLALPDAGPLGGNAIPGDPDGWFALEACEYDRSFLELAPFGAIVTNVEADHLDYYGDLAAIEAAFASFLVGVDPSGLVVLGESVPAVVEEGASGEVWRLGRELLVRDEGPVEGRRRFVLSGPGWATPPVHLAVPGKYNVENAACALGLALGLATRSVRRSEWPRLAAVAAAGLMTFGGAGRRFESWGFAAGVPVIHDYAHHPTELAALLGAAREAFPARELCLLFQPHQSSRTARLLDDFAAALAPASGTEHADRLVVAPVYGARRHIDGAHAAGAPELAAAVVALGGRARYASTLVGSIDATASEVVQATAPVVLVVGAGDVEDVREALLEALTSAFAAPHLS